VASIWLNALGQIGSPQGWLARMRLATAHMPGIPSGGKGGGDQRVSPVRMTHIQPKRSAAKTSGR
jgi:hypothetical protein